MSVPPGRPVSRPPDFLAPMADKAFYGLSGALVRRMAPWTEAGPRRDARAAIRRVSC